MEKHCMIASSKDSSVKYNVKICIVLIIELKALGMPLSQQIITARLSCQPKGVEEGIFWKWIIS